MPNVWAHISFAEKIAHKADYRFSPECKPFLRLGGQGPDPFFYHNFWPWIKEKPVPKMGEKIHYEKCGPYLIEMIQYVQRHMDEKLKAYVFGFITHHLLDRNTHPYIIFRSGDEGNKHQRLEVIIDTLLMQEWHEITTWNTPVYKEIYIGKQLYAPIKDMLAFLNTTYFPETAQSMPQNYIEKAYQHMIKALRVLFDPYGWKNKLLKERVSPFSYQNNVAKKDYLNLQRSEWSHPSDLNEKYSHSFLDLWAQAEGEGGQILSLVLQYWEQPTQEIFEDIKKLIGSRSYDTGKDCELGLTNRYFEPIL